MGRHRTCCVTKEFKGNKEMFGQVDHRRKNESLWKPGSHLLSIIHALWKSYSPIPSTFWSENEAVAGLDSTVDEEWLAKVQVAPQLIPSGILDNYEVVLPNFEETSTAAV